MAQFPCSRCGQRYRGPQQTAYPAIVDGGDSERAKRRLCPDCLAVTDRWIQDRLVPGDDPEPVLLCSACANPDPDLAVFVTLYRAGKDREDWFGRIHNGECRAQVFDVLMGVKP